MSAGEDEDGIYSKLMLKTIISANLYSHKRMICCLSDPKLGSSTDLISQLPKRTESQAATAPSSPSDMKIAWRYKNMPDVDTKSCGKYQYDFGSFIDENEITDHNLYRDDIFVVSSIEDILDDDKDISRIDWHKVSLIIIERISINNVDEDRLCKNFYRLKSITRSHPGVACVVTINPSEMTTKAKSRMMNMSDGVFFMESFPQKSLTYPDSDGLFNMHKLPKVLSINYATKLDTLDYGFQMRKNSRFLVLDKLCLPPEAEDRPSRSTAVTPCQSSIDF